MLSTDALQVVEIARAAGRKILARYGRPSLSVNDKTDGSPVTDADLEADRYIRGEALAARWPFPIVSEETEVPDFEDRAEWVEWWLVDPLDGTRDFVAGTNEFCVCIARVFDGLPELGVLYAPVTGVAWAAERMNGAWRFERGATEPTRIVCPEREGPITAFKSRFHSLPEAEKWVRAAGATALTDMGSALKFAAIAEGQADLFVSMSSAKLWDLAAGQVIAEESGARVLALDTKKPPRHDGISLLAGPFAVLGRRLDATTLDRVEYVPR